MARPAPAKTVYELEPGMAKSLREARKPVRTRDAQCQWCKTKTRSHKKFKGITTSYCIKCAMVHDEQWYKAYKAASSCAICDKGRRIHASNGQSTTSCCMDCVANFDAKWFTLYCARSSCAKCQTSKRATEEYEERKTAFCYNCAKVQDPQWHTARLKANQCHACLTRLQSTEKHAERRTAYCIMCAKQHDPLWHSAYIAATRCVVCRINAKASRQYGELTTECCVTCARTHDPLWYDARFTETRCLACDWKMRATEVYDERTTACCIACAAEHDPVWHDARVAATRCKYCNKKARAHDAFNGCTTDYCIACSEMHDTDWYEAWRKAHACKTPHCVTYGAAHLKGFCKACFCIQYPIDTRSRNYKSKEVEFARRIALRFPQFNWRFDKRIIGSLEPHGPRPDAMPLGFALPDAAEDVAYDVENDEFSHRDRACESERQKLKETLRRTGKKQLVVFRFNQDEYHDVYGMRIPSCWGYNKATGRVHIVERQRAQLDARFHKLFQVMAMYLEEGQRPPPDIPIFVLELFYDNYDDRHLNVMSPVHEF